MSHRQLDREQVHRPLRRSLAGEAVPHAELVEQAGWVAEAFVKRGGTFSIKSDGPWAGVWNLDQLRDAASCDSFQRLARHLDEGIGWGRHGDNLGGNVPLGLRFEDWGIF